MRDIRRSSRSLRTSRPVLAALLTAAATIGTAVSATPTVAAPADPAAFWTAERMRQAAPLELPVMEPGRLKAPSLARGAERTVAPTLPGTASAAGALAFPNGA